VGRVNATGTPVDHPVSGGPVDPATRSAALAWKRKGDRQKGVAMAERTRGSSPEKKTCGGGKGFSLNNEGKGGDRRRSPPNKGISPTGKGFPSGDTTFAVLYVGDQC